MRRRTLSVVAVLCCMACLAGCWDYRGMDEINIVAGVAIDKSDAGDSYRLTLEIVNLSAIKDGNGAPSLLVTAEGPTLFDAVRNSKKKLYNKLYFGSMRAIIVDKDLAREEGILGVIDGFLRDIEPRETTLLVISQEDTAQELIQAKGLDTSIVSYEIAQIIEEDNNVDYTSKKVQMYEAYNTVMAKGLELVLPAFHVVKNNGDKVAEIDGIAIFHHDRLVEFLPPEETHYYLMVIDEQVGGVVSFPYAQGHPEIVSAEIYSCKSRPKTVYAEGSLSISIAVEVQLGIVESPTTESPSEKNIEQMQFQAEKHLESRIMDVLRHVQQNPGCDIFGFGNKIYENQYPLWQEIGEDWETLYQDAKFKLDVRVNIINTGLTS